MERRDWLKSAGLWTAAALPTLLQGAPQGAPLQPALRRLGPLKIFDVKTILTAPAGEKGFGYDPVFVPEGDTRSFAQLTMEEKNRYSHRRKAADQLTAFLQQTR